MVRLSRKITKGGQTLPLKPILLKYLHLLDGASSESLEPTKEEMMASTVTGKTWKLQTTSQSLWVTTNDPTQETYIALKFS